MQTAEASVASPPSTSSTANSNCKQSSNNKGATPHLAPGRFGRLRRAQLPAPAAVAALASAAAAAAPAAGRCRVDKPRPELHHQRTQRRAHVGQRHQRREAALRGEAARRPARRGNGAKCEGVGVARHSFQAQAQALVPKLEVRV
eukprot:202787-Chlamydomonas_euryale.AAC.3